MITGQELESLMEILNRKQDTLERVEEIFLSKFKDTHTVFRTTYSLARLLSLNLLTSLQRIPAIFLLIENYKNQGINKHPFGTIIFQLSHETLEPFERQMIAHMIIDSRREEYSKTSIQSLEERAQSMINPVEERPEIVALENEHISKMPKVIESGLQISRREKSQVTRVIRDFMEKEREFEFPDYQVHLATIEESQMSNEAYNVGFMRPLPEFLPVEASELHWFAPQIASDVNWDHSSLTNKKLHNAKMLLRKSTEQHLPKDDYLLIEKALDSEPSAVLHLQVSTEMLSPMIKKNPFIVSTVLIKLSNFPIFDLYMEAILKEETSSHLIEMVSTVVKAARVSPKFIVSFTEEILEKTIATNENEKDKKRLAKAVIGFIKNQKKVKALNLEDIQEALDRFIQKFMAVEEIQQFKKLLAREPTVN